MELGEEEDLGNEASIFVSATSSIPLYSIKSFTSTPIKPFLVKAVIKRHEDKLFERKWKKCWKIQEIKEFNDNCQRRKPVQIQKKISAKLTREHGETGQPVLGKCIYLNNRAYVL